MLADANMPILEAVLSFSGGSTVHVPAPGSEVLSLAARFRNLRRPGASVPLALHTNPAVPGLSVPSGSVGTLMSMASNLIKSSPRMSESLDDDDEDDGEDGLGLKLRTLGATAEEELGPRDSGPELTRNPSPARDRQAQSPLPPLPPLIPPSSIPPAAPVAPVSVASYFGGFGKKISAFGVSSLETVRSNIAAAQLAHQQQQELLRQQQALNPPQEAGKGAVLWSTPDISSFSSSSSSSSSAVRNNMDGGIAYLGGLRSAIASKMSTARGPADDKVQVSLPGVGVSSNTFVIDEEDEGDEDDGMGPRDIDPQKIGVSKTDTERAQVGLCVQRACMCMYV